MADHKEEMDSTGNMTKHREAEHEKPVTAGVSPNHPLQPPADALNDGKEKFTIRSTEKTEGTVQGPTISSISKTDVLSKTEEGPGHVADGEANSQSGPEDEEEPLPGVPETGSITTSSISNPALEIDPMDDSDDLDSAISGTGRESSTDSVRSSVYDFVEEYGRTYHRYKQGKYLLPNDSTEQDRLDLQHHLALVLLDGRLNLAPINPNLQNVLDIGTGTGIWAIQFAEKHPSASVIGTDLSPIQPAFVPPNCRFEIDDAEDEWTFSTKFDFIHMRGMLTCFSDHSAQIAKAFNALAPGGYLEMLDPIFPLQCHDDTLLGTALDTWAKTCVEAAAKMGRPWTNTPHYKRWMIEVGFEDVHEKVFEVPTNTWPRGKKAKELGLLLGADLSEAVVSTMAFMTKGMGWSTERVEQLLVDVRKDIKDRAIHAYLPLLLVWGRKPKASTVGTV